MILAPVARVKNISIAMDNSKIAVAVGILFNEQKEVLVASRFFQQKECWEFPGGKIEAGETVAQALKRELKEEIGIEVLAHEPWLMIDHAYAHRTVCLQVHKVLSYEGQPQGCEGQKIQWLKPAQLRLLAVPQANIAIVEALQNLS